MGSSLFVRKTSLPHVNKTEIKWNPIRKNRINF